MLAKKSLNLLKRFSAPPHLQRAFTATTGATQNEDNLFFSETLRDGKLLILRLNNPKKRNALSKQMLTEMNESIDALIEDTQVQTVILSSSNPNMFCAGADLKERIGLTNEQTEETVKGLRSTFQRIYEIPVPVIACMDGFCLGGGLELALACDIRVATKGAKVGLTELNLAIIPGAGGTVRLPRLVGTGLAKELIYTGKILTAQEGHELGILNHVEEDFGLAFEKCVELADVIGKKGPVAVRAAKYALNQSNELGLADALKHEEASYRRILHTKDRLEGLNAFMDKRKPEYQGE